MKLSLSCRVAESSSRKDVAALPIDELIVLARAARFQGLSMRASAVSVDSVPCRVRDIRRQLEANGLQASMVMGNVALAANNAQAPECLRNITPHLDLADALGATLVRVMLQHDDDIGHARRAADEAAERGITLAQQTHWGTLCETVPQTIDVVQRVNREHFGITFEPANLLACGEADLVEALKRVQANIVNFYFQNVRLNPRGTHTFVTRARGPVALDYVAIDDATAIDVRPLLEVLEQGGYRGWITVHQPLTDAHTVATAIDEAANAFVPLCAGR